LHEEGFVKVWRKIKKWEWYDDDETLAFFVRLIMKANWEDKRWHGHVVPRGSFIAGRKTLAKEFKRSERRIRTLVERLKATSELTSKSTNRFTIYTLVNYEKYQSRDFETTSQVTSQPSGKRPASRQQETTTKEVQEVKEDKEIYIKTQGVFRPPTRGSETMEKFDEFWSIYPKKVGKLAAYRVWAALKLNGETDSVIEAVKKQMDSKNWQEKKFIPKPENWLADGRWDDAVEEADPFDRFD